MCYFTAVNENAANIVHVRRTFSTVAPIKTWKSTKRGSFVTESVTEQQQTQRQTRESETVSPFTQRTIV